VLTLRGQLTPPAGAGAALWLSSPTRYLHEAHDAWQGEVGLLTRTVSAQGSNRARTLHCNPALFSLWRVHSSHCGVVCAASFIWQVVVQGAPADSEPSDTWPVSCPSGGNGNQGLHVFGREQTIPYTPTAHSARTLHSPHCIPRPVLTVAGALLCVLQVPAHLPHRFRRARASRGASDAARVGRRILPHGTDQRA
jgi:hypothetical protein